MCELKSKLQVKGFIQFIQSALGRRLSFQTLNFVKKRSQNCPEKKVVAWRYFNALQQVNG